ncbi:serine hydrolase domain-containing protein [Paenibacillus lutrae]|uniref:serine hydrolase domain-containing protein n=1 Tax=Paenibacillus lutrae TaxID=2078573 RepID=UPI0012F765A4|nr:serine hydrolase domain-containing protein [Paenibacillus lutrae]
MAALSIWTALWFFYPIMDRVSGEGSPYQSGQTFESGQIDSFDSFIQKKMEDGKIPGLSVTIVDKKQILYQKGFGIADQTKAPVTPETLFEIGSTSKAFTGLGILLLQEKGRLQMTDEITRYLPSFAATFQGTRPKLTLENFMYQTSGIPFRTIGDIPVASGEDALEQTVKVLDNIELDFLPGTKFSYATLNYDVLGLVIEKVTGQRFDDFIRSELLTPLEMNQTFTRRADVDQQKLAAGYKLLFGQPQPYQAPEYRGNTPAGYFIISGYDLAKWLQIQLGESTPVWVRTLVHASQNPNTQVQRDYDGSLYASGWFAYLKESTELSHGGGNPNYSSYFVLNPDKGLGVGILANMNSSYTQEIGQGIMDMLMGRAVQPGTSDQFLQVDRIAGIVTVITGISTLVLLILLAKGILQIRTGTRRYAGLHGRLIMRMLVMAVLLPALAYLLYRINDIVFDGLNWSFVQVWAPASLFYALYGIWGCALLFCLYDLFARSCPAANSPKLTF